MKKHFILTMLFFIGIHLIANAQTEKDMTTANTEEGAIRALMDRFAAAFNTGDVDAIMKNYISGKSLVVFDVVPRKEYLGSGAYRAAWKEMFSHYDGRPKIEIADLGITAGGDVAFGYSFMHVTGKDKQGHIVDRWVRVTDGYRKIDGNWLIVQEHISVPVDFATGKLMPIAR